MGGWVGREAGRLSLFRARHHPFSANPPLSGATRPPDPQNQNNRPGDEVHLVHVVPRVQQAAVFGAPPVDFLPQQDPAAYAALIKNAEAFIAARFLPRLLALSPDPVVHVVKADVDTDSIGNVVCRKAGDLGAAALVMASHSKSRLQEFFLGSVTAYCCHHSPAPVLVVK